MLLFAQEGYQELADDLVRQGGARPASHQVDRFPNRELRASLEPEQVEGRECAVLGTVAPPDENLLSLLLLSDTLEKEGASTVTAVLPYLAYARQDRDEPGRSRAAAWLGRVLAASGVDRVVTVDPHSEAVDRLFPVPVVTLRSHALLARRLREAGLEEATLVAPDEGARPRCEALARAAELAAPVAHLAKRRTWDAGIEHLSLEGEVRPVAVVLDDMLDTGGTMVSCCRILRERGVRRTVVMVTHGLFTGSGWAELWELGVERIVCTDTVPDPPSDDRIERLSVAPLLAEALRQPARSR